MMYGDYPSSRSRSVVLIAAPPHEPAAPDLADELERLVPQRVVVTSDVGRYSGRMSACIVVLRPQTARSSALHAIFDERPPLLIPVLAAPMVLPPGPWTTPPVTLARGVEVAAFEVADALRGTRAPHSRPVYPPAPAYPTTPAYPSRPLHPMAPGPAYPGAAFGPAQMPAASPRRSHAALWIAGSLALVVLIALAGIGGLLALKRSNVLAPHPSPTVPAHFTTYTDTGGLYRLTVPQGWSTRMENTIIGFVSPSAQAVFEVTSISVTMSSNDIRTNEDEYFKALASGAGGSGTYTNLQGPSPVTLAGATWTRESADVTVKGSPAHAVILIANHGSNAFLLAYFAYSNVFASTDAGDFQPMLNSFTFLK